MTTTKEQVKAALDTVRAVADCIQALGKVPNGELYARVMAHTDLATYNKVVETLINCKLVENRMNVLCWTGPQLQEAE